MWRPWMEAHAARMRARAQKELEASEVLGKPIRGKDPRNRAAEWATKPRAAQLKQIVGLLAEHEKRKTAARERYENAKIVEVTVVKAASASKTLGRPIGSKDFVFEYPNCPRCDATEVKRAGFNNGLQRFKCLVCRRSFGSDLRVQTRVETFHVTCHRCGGNGQYLSKVTNTGRRTSSGGVRARCPHCAKTFTQGGPEHLERTMVLLLERVEKAHPDPLVRAELLQTASLEVLEGKAYTWNVPLNFVKANEATREFSRETTKYRRDVRGERWDD